MPCFREAIGFLPQRTDNKMNGVPGLHGMNPIDMPPQNQPAIIKRFNSPEELQSVINQYFDDCEATNRTLTGAGLARHLDLDRTTLINYLNGRTNGITAEWRRPLKVGWRRIEEDYERTLRSNHMVGSIFALKNMGWSDQMTQVLEMPDIKAAADAIRAGFGDLLTAVRESKQVAHNASEQLLAQEKPNESG